MQFHSQQCVLRQLVTACSGITATETTLANSVSTVIRTGIYSDHSDADCLRTHCMWSIEPTVRVKKVALPKTFRDIFT